MNDMTFMFIRLFVLIGVVIAIGVFAGIAMAQPESRYTITKWTGTYADAKYFIIETTVDDRSTFCGWVRSPQGDFYPMDDISFSYSSNTFEFKYKATGYSVRFKYVTYDPDKKLINAKWKYADGTLGDDIMFHGHELGTLAE